MKVFCLLIFSVIIFSCKKSNELTERSNIIQTPVLLKMYELDTSLVAPFDTISRIDFTYDASGRIISSTELNRKSNGDTNNFNTRIYQYLGNDTLAWRTIYHEQYFLGTAVGGPAGNLDTTVYNYFDGKLVYDSTFTYFVGTSRDYSVKRNTYYDDSIILDNNGYLTHHGPIIRYNIRSKLILSLAGGLPVLQIDTSKYVADGLVDMYDFKDQITYEDNPNPLFIRSKPIKQLYTNTYYVLDYKLRNNDLPKLYTHREIYEHHWITGVPTNGSTTLEDNTYEFRSDGYPTINRKTIKYGTLSPKTTKWIYIYQ